MGRPGQPNEVAPCFLFLACEDSSYMTGQVLHPDGGNTLPVEPPNFSTNGWRPFTLVIELSLG